MIQSREPKKIRCKNCGHIIAIANKPITGGEISIMCNNRHPDGKRCKTVNLIIPDTPKN